MGASYNSYTVKGSLTIAQLKDDFKEHQERARYEHGSSYSGDFNMVSSLSVRPEMVFDTENAAQEYVAATAQKWEFAVAVRLKTRDNLEIRKQAKPSARYAALGQKIEQLTGISGANNPHSIHDTLKRNAFAVRKKEAEFIKCTSCKSVLASKYLHSSDCPMCRTSKSLLSVKDMKKIETLMGKVNALTAQRDELMKVACEKVWAKLPASEQYEWYVGAWCAS